MSRFPVRFVLLAVVAAAGVARADDPVIMVTHSGYLLDGSDAAVTARSVPFSFTLWNDPESTVATNRVWPATGSEPPTCSIDVDRGRYAVILGGGSDAQGCGTGLTAAALPPTAARYLEVTIDGKRFTPRLKLSAVPNATYAATAATAKNADNAKLAESATKADDAKNAENAAKFNNKTYAEMLTELDGRYPKADVVSAVQAAVAEHEGKKFGIHGVTGDLVGTSDTQILTQKTIDGSLNTIFGLGNSAIGASANIDRSKLAKGTAGAVLINDDQGAFSSEATLSLTRGGTGAATAIGGFKALSPLTTKGDALGFDGTNNVRIPVGTTGQVLTADPSAAAGMLWKTISVPPSGTVPQASTAPFTCNSSAGGSQYYDTTLKQLRVCNGTAFVALGPSGATPGLAPESAPASCEAILAANTSAASGVYFIDPAGGGASTAYQVYCEMRLANGAWTLAMNLDSNDGNTRYFQDTAWWTGDTAFGNVTAALSNDYKSKETFSAPYTEIMVLVHREGTEQVGWRTWNFVQPGSLRQFLSTHSPSRNPGALTGPSTDASVGNVNAAEAFVRPQGAIKVNMIWGAGASPDEARLRNDALNDLDNQQWGIGTQMDFQNNNGLPWYPGCDAAGMTAWKTYMCIGDDSLQNPGNGDAAPATGGAKDLQYDYAIFVRGRVATPVIDASLVGNAQASAAVNCPDVKAKRSTAKNGAYWIDPNGGDKSDAYQVICELETDDGGWTLAMNLDSSDGNVRFYQDFAWWTANGGFGSIPNALTADYKLSPAFGQVGYSKIMIRVHRENVEQVGWRTWQLAGASSLQQIFAVGATRSPTAFTSGSTASDVSRLPGVEIVVRPAGQLAANFIWGAAASPDEARIRNMAMSGNDNTDWGLGTQMDFQNNGGNPWYPGCDAAASTPWKTYMCIGDDQAQNLSNGDAAPTSGGAKDLQYDYAIYLK